MISKKICFIFCELLERYLQFLKKEYENKVSWISEGVHVQENKDFFVFFKNSQKKNMGIFFKWKGGGNVAYLFCSTTIKNVEIYKEKVIRELNEIKCKYTIKIFDVFSKKYEEDENIIFACQVLSCLNNLAEKKVVMKNFFKDFKYEPGIIFEISLI